MTISATATTTRHHHNSSHRKHSRTNSRRRRHTAVRTTSRNRQKKQHGGSKWSHKRPPAPKTIPKGSYGGSALFSSTQYEFPDPSVLRTAHAPQTFQWWSDVSSPPSESSSGILSNILSTIQMGAWSAQTTVRNTLKRANYLQSLGYKVEDVASVTKTLTPKQNGSNAATCTFYAIRYRRYKPAERDQLRVRDTRRELCAWIWTSHVLKDHHEMGQRELAFSDTNRSRIQHVATTWNTERTMAKRFFDSLFGSPYNIDTQYSTVWYFA